MLLSRPFLSAFSRPVHQRGSGRGEGKDKEKAGDWKSLPGFIEPD
jgi:hypothetical protein